MMATRPRSHERALLRGSLLGAIAVVGACASFGASPAPDDGVGNDAGAESDAADVLDGAEASPAPACAKAAIAGGATFESSAFPPSPWTQVLVGNGSLGRSTDVRHMGAASFKAVATPGDGEVEAQLEQDFDLDPVTIDLRHAMNVTVKAGTEADLGCTIKLSPPSGEDETRLLLTVQPGGDLVATAFGSVAGGDFDDRHALFPEVEAGWYEVHQLATVTADGVAVKVEMIAPSRTRKELTFTTKRPAAISRIGINCGIDFARADEDHRPGSATAYVDDIAFEICPR